MVRIGLLGLFFAAGPLSATSPAQTNGSVELSRGLEKQAFALINDYRAGQGLSPLVWNGDIAEMARRHSRDMATGAIDFGHEGFGERMRQLRELFIGMRGGGENIFESDDDRGIAQAAVATWLKSPPHLHNIRGDFNYSGLGLWRNPNGAYYFTQIFVKATPAEGSNAAESNNFRFSHPELVEGSVLLSLLRERPN
jgi:uncharacterized protein YkwD